MSVTHTPPDRIKPLGSSMASALDRVESGYKDLLEHIATHMECVDGGEANAGDSTKVGRVVADYGYATAAEAVLAIGQLQALRAVFNNNQAALDQAFNRLRMS